MIGVLGFRIWVENRVDFANPINLTTGAVALIVGIADYTWVLGELAFAGIALGTAAALIVYHAMSAVAGMTGAVATDETSRTVPSAHDAPMPQDAVRGVE